MSAHAFAGKPIEFFQAVDWALEFPKEWARALRITGGDVAAGKAFIVDANFGLSRERIPARKDEQVTGFRAMQAFEFDARKHRRVCYQSTLTKRRSDGYWRTYRLMRAGLA